MTLPPPRAAYVHLPFCLRRCFYCDFPVVPLGDKADGSRNPSVDSYLELLLREIATTAQGPPLSTVYLGGGTPSLLTADQVEGVLGALRARYGLAAGAEITLEMDPATFDQARLQALLECGINRVSLGGQSFDDAVLRGLGRHHRRHHLIEAAGWLHQARQQGQLRSWSLDLIQGLPALPEGPTFQSIQDWRDHWLQQLEQAIQLRPPHLSIYDLSIEPGTVFAKRLQRGTLEMLENELAADQMEITASRLRSAGYGRYEISNYALPGHPSRHNRVYWCGAGWWGFGMGATEAPFGQRVAKPRTRSGYAEWLRDRKPSCREIPRAFPLDDLVIVGLRRREGISMGRLLDAHGLSREDLEALKACLAPWLDRGLLSIEGDRWRLSDPEGLALSNLVLRDFLAWWMEHPASLQVAVGESIPAEPQSPVPSHSARARQTEAGVP